MTRPIRCVEIQRALYCREAHRAWVTAANVHVCLGESDFLSVSRAKYVDEFEIKLSRADFRADLRKFVYTHRGPYDHRVARAGYFKHEALGGLVPINPACRLVIPRRFWFVAPAGLIPLEDVPAHAGLLQAERGLHGGLTLRVAKPPAKIPHATKLEGPWLESMLRNQAIKLMQHWHTKTLTADVAAHLKAINGTTDE